MMGLVSLQEETQELPLCAMCISFYLRSDITKNGENVCLLLKLGEKSLGICYIIATTLVYT